MYNQTSTASFVRGFTLIELLVVIAIIGLLSAVVLAAVNGARVKGIDAAIKRNLSTTRTIAEVFYDTNLTYAGVCAVTGTSVIGGSVNAAEIAFKGSVTSYVLTTASTFGASGTGQCHENGTAWAAWVPLKTSPTNTAWCVDSTGASKQVTAVLAASAVVCP